MPEVRGVASESGDGASYMWGQRGATLQVLAGVAEKPWNGADSVGWCADVEEDILHSLHTARARRCKNKQQFRKPAKVSVHGSVQLDYSALRVPKTNWQETKRLRKEDCLREEADRLARGDDSGVTTGKLREAVIEYQLVATDSDGQGWLEDGVDWDAAKN